MFLTKSTTLLIIRHNTFQSIKNKFLFKKGFTNEHQPCE